MRSRARLWLFAAPLLGPVARAFAQANTNTPATRPGVENMGEVQVGAGTQGDVTTGSSGPQKKKGGDKDDKGAAKKDAPGASAKVTGTKGANGKKGQGR